MQHLLSRSATFLVCLLCSVLAARGLPTAKDQPDYPVRIGLANSLRTSNPDSSLSLHATVVLEALGAGDTLAAVSALLESSKTSGHQADYKEAYDKLWRALLLAEAADLPTARIQVYLQIGRYFSFYKRREKAFDYFDRALTLNRELIAEGRLAPQSLVNIFHTYLSTCRELDEPESMRPYLDSVRQYYAPVPGSTTTNVIAFEEAFLLGQTGEEKRALTLFQKVIPWFRKSNPGYLTLIYTYLGDVHAKLDDFALAEQSYRKALAASKRTSSHLDFTPIIHRQLADLYQRQGKFQAANASLERFIALDDRFFDSRSAANRPLLGIQDDYRAAMEKRAREAREEKLKRLERDRELQYFKTAALSVSIVLLLLLAALSFLYLRANHRTEKKLLRQERALELRKANEIVDLKNKELAANTLKLIAKDEFITDIQERLARFQTNPDASREVGTILRNIRSNTDNGENWQAFEARFVAVNQDFYQTLRDQYPKLTQGDLKLCALIKLNFSSKDIARLMGISVESVHTTRYRVRKKLGLERKDNLVEFIATV